MLRITVPEAEFYDEAEQVFITTKEQKLCLEHSLVSVSKWESKWKKAFLTEKEKSTEELVDYVRCMTLTQNVDPNVYLALTNKNLDDVTDYIKDAMSATCFPKEETKPGPKNRDVITSELIYYWMIAYTIPMECQKWHLNRLINLIRICQMKNTPDKKMSKAEVAKRHKALNAARRKKLGTKG